MKIVVFLNQKGGVGKTTLAFHYIHYLRNKKQRVLAVDLDPQGNLTHSLWRQDETFPESAHAGLLFEKLQPRPLHIHGIHLIGSDIHLARHETNTRLENFFRLKNFLKHVKGYDTVVVDTPPSLGLFTANAIVAAHHLFTPLDTSRYALLGLKDLQETLRMVSEVAGGPSDFTGVVLLKVKSRTLVGRELETVLEEEFQDRYLGSIPESVIFSEATFRGIPVWKLAPVTHTAVLSFLKVLKRMARATEEVIHAA